MSKSKLAENKDNKFWKLATITVVAVVATALLVQVFAAPGDPVKYDVTSVSGGNSKVVADNTNQAYGGSFVEFANTPEPPPPPPPTNNGNCPAAAKIPTTINGKRECLRVSVKPGQTQPTYFNIQGTDQNDFLDYSSDTGKSGSYSGFGRIYGGAGDDIIIWDGTQDNVNIYGGPGADIFVFNRGIGHDILHDFNPSEGDRIFFLPLAPIRTTQTSVNACKADPNCEGFEHFLLRLSSANNLSFYTIVDQNGGNKWDNSNVHPHPSMSIYSTKDTASIANWYSYITFSFTPDKCPSINGQSIHAQESILEEKYNAFRLGPYGAAGRSSEYGTYLQPKPGPLSWACNPYYNGRPTQ